MIRGVGKTTWTDGGCDFYYDESGRDWLISNIKESIELALTACEAFGVNFDLLLKEVKSENDELVNWINRDKN